MFQEFRKITNGSIPIYAFQSGAVAGILFLFGPEHLGGNGDLLEKMKPIMDLPEDEKNKEAERVCLALRSHAPITDTALRNQLYRRVRSDLLDLPGLPPMHDYEHYPQKVCISALKSRFISPLTSTQIVFDPAISFLSAPVYRSALLVSDVVLLFTPQQTIQRVRWHSNEYHASVRGTIS